MAHDFPHLNDSSFPNVSNVNVYNPANEVNYEREYDKVICKLTLLSVPWDVGLVHVGQAQIGGVGHVWHAGTKAARNAWFEAQAKKQGSFVKTWETEYRRFHAKDLEIKLEISATEAAKYNYCQVEYYKLPHETSNTKRRLEWWGFFVREWREESADVSTAILLRDAWQTFIYDMDIPYMFLTRGHAPMSKTTADQYLVDPVSNNEWLLAPDVNFSNGAYKNVYQTAFVFNDDVWACIAITGFTRNGWGTPESTWANAGDSYEQVQGVSTTDLIISMTPANLETFLRNVDEQAPQFKQNISAVFFIGKKLVTRGTAFNLFGVSVAILNAQRKRTRFVTLSKEQFGYDSKYADIAKLYTQPYAHLEIVTENGETIVVNIEDTHGEIDLSYSANLVYPFLSIDAHLLGIGGGEDHNLTFMNLENVSFDYGGAWYGTLKRWDIPTFAVVQPSAIRANYQTWYLRQQQSLEATTAQSDSNTIAETAKANAYDSADTAKTNADNEANTAKTNADNEADTTKTNADNSADTAKANADAQADAGYLQTDNSADNIEANNATAIALASAMKQNDNALSTEGRVESTTKLQRDLSADRTNMSASYQAESASNAVAQANNDTMAAAGAANTALSTVGGAVGGFFSGGPAGAVMGALGGIGQGINTYASWTTANAALLVQMTNIYEVYEAGWNASYNKFSAAFDYMVNSTTIQINYTDANIELQNTANTTIAERNAALMLANATIAQNTAKNNATRDKATANTNAANSANTAKTNAANSANTAKTNAANTSTLTKDNADREYSTAINNATRDYNTALSAINNALKQARLEPNQVFGQPMNAENATTKPQALFASIVTQSKSAIAQAGDEFLRFGYNCNRQWPFETWLVMPKFTYWQCEEIWIKGLSIADAYADEIRFFLMGGVTVWRNPEDIGNVSIYDNK